MPYEAPKMSCIELQAAKLICSSRTPETKVSATYNGFTDDTDEQW